MIHSEFSIRLSRRIHLLLMSMQAKSPKWYEFWQGMKKTHLDASCNIPSILLHTIKFNHTKSMATVVKEMLMEMKS